MKKTMEIQSANHYETPEITDIPSLSNGLVLQGTSPGGGEGGGDEEGGDD